VSPSDRSADCMMLLYAVSAERRSSGGCYVSVPILYPASVQAFTPPSMNTARSNPSRLYFAA